MADATVEDVEDLYGETAMQAAAKERLVDMANRLGDNNFGSRIARTGEVEGSERDFKALLGAHLWTLREGEAQSESQTGGSVSYNVISGDLEDSLSETRWGRMAQAYLRDGASISVQRT